MGTTVVQSDIRVKLIPVDEFLEEVSDPVLEVLAEGAEDIVQYARENHPYQDRTGTNTASIGWAISAYGRETFGTLKTGKGAESVGGEIQSERDNPTAIVASSSGYGGFLEVGTRFMQAFPYIKPAFDALKDKIFKSLEDII
jgi:HK97 gp10 family phage protein